MGSSSTRLLYPKEWPHPKLRVCKHRTSSKAILGQNFAWNLCACEMFQTNIATSLGLTLSPYFCLKHSMNKLRGDSVPKSTWLFGEAPSKVLANSLVAFLSSSRRSDISWLCPRQASHWVLLSLLVVIELVWQLLSIRKPTCYDILCQLRCNSTKRKPVFWIDI